MTTKKMPDLEGKSGPRAGGDGNVTDPWYASDKATFHNRLKEVAAQIAVLQATITPPVATVASKPEPDCSGLPTWAQRRDSPEACRVFERACRDGLPAHIERSKQHIRQLPGAVLSQRWASMVEREDHKMTDLEGLLVVREYLKKNPAAAFGRRFGKWVVVNEPLISLFGHRLHGEE